MVKLKGFDKFREKTPILNGKRIVIIPVYILTLILITFFILTQFYLLPGRLSSEFSWQILSILPLVSVLLMEFIGLILVSQMWIWRDILRKKYDQFSYQKIFPVGLAGIIIIISLAFNIYIDFSSYSASFWHNYQAFFLVKPFYQLFGSNESIIIHDLQTLLGSIFLILGLCTSLRSIFTFGFDNTTVVYVYFPEESEIKENQIYSVIRHPMYSGMILVAFGGFLTTFTLYSFLFFTIFFLGFYVHVHFVEEPELLARFGESYKSYTKKVPPFFINPVNFPNLMKFILKGG